jgi:hypothetical protein
MEFSPDWSTIIVGWMSIVVEMVGVIARANVADAGNHDGGLSLILGEPIVIAARGRNCEGRVVRRVNSKIGE